MNNYFKLFMLLFSLLQSTVDAKDVSYALKLSNHHPYVGEATFLEVNLTQENHDKVMMFNFTLKKSQDYSFHQVGFKEHEEYHDLRHEYKYLIYPKKSGKISIEFKLIQSLTNDEKVAYAISGDRDNVKGLEKQDTLVPIEPLALEVKPLASNVNLVGDFKLSYELDKRETHAFDPVNLKVILKGKGSVEAFELLKKSQNYKLFTQAPQVKAFHSKEGTSTTIEWDYAISASKDFVLPKVLLKAFNPQTQKVYELSIPSYSIKVNEVAEASLLDNEDSPLPLSSKGIDWEFWRWIVSYVFVFLAGFLMPRNLFSFKSAVEKSDEILLEEKIEAAKSHKELLQILLLEKSVKFAQAISTLEDVLYNKGEESLSKIKGDLQKVNNA